MDTKKKKKKEEKPKVAIIFYRDGGNYKNNFMVELPKGSTLKVSKDDEDFIDISALGISHEEWEEDFLGQLAGGYDEELDHTSVTIEKIRDMRKGDIMFLNKVITNTDCKI